MGAGDPILGERLRRLRERKGLARAAAARAAGLPEDALARLEAGESDPPLSLLHRLADALGCSLAEILALPPAPLACDIRLHPESAAAARRVSEFVPVPLVSGEAAGGNARLVDESVLGWLFLPREEFGRREGHLIAVRIMGRSMEPELPDGCIAVVDRAERAVTGGGIYALRDQEGGCTVKRVEVLDPRYVALVPTNRSEYKVEFWKFARGESLADRLIGRVVWAGFSFLGAGQGAERQLAHGADGGGEEPTGRSGRRRVDEEPF